MMEYIAAYSLWLLLMKNVYVPPHNYYNYGNQLYEQGNYGEAEMYYQKAASYENLRTECLFNAGNAAFYNNSMEEAIHYYEQAMQRAPDDEDIWHNLELAYKQLKTVEVLQPKIDEKSKHSKKKKQGKKKLDLKKGLTKDDADRLLERAGAAEKRYRYMLKRQKGGIKRDLSSTDIFSSSPELIFEYIKTQTKASYPFKPGKSLKKKKATDNRIDW